MTVTLNNPPTLDILDETTQLAGSASREQKDHNWYVIRQYGTTIGTWLQGYLDSYDVRFSNMIANSEKVDEVVDARVDAFSKTYDTLKSRIDAIQLDKLSKIDSQDIDDLRTIQFTDISTSSTPLALGTTTNISDDFSNPYWQGMIETSITKITVNEVTKLD